MKKPTTLLGVTILTPALIAGEAHAAPARTNVVAVDTAALSRLKAGMLALDPTAKLKLAADRLPATSTSTSTTTHAVVHSATTANCHTQHNNAQTHHNAITQPTSAVANTSVSANPSGGAPSASPSTAPAQQTHTALTPPPPQGITKGSQGFQPPQQGVTKGSN